MWHDIISTINTHERFIISSHMNPDCDALGSELALAEHLKNLGKTVKVINNDPIPATYRFIDPKKKAKKYSSRLHDKIIAEAEVIIVVDASGGWKRLGRPGEVLEKANAVKLCIDHHPDPVDFVDVAVVDTDAAATAQMIYDLLMVMEAKISPRMARAMYAGILTDTGSFRFPKTSSHTHTVAARLFEYGVNPLEIHQKIHEQSSLGRLRVKGYALENLQLAAEGQIAYYGLSQQVMRQYNVSPSDLDGFASLGQEIKGVRVVIYAIEIGQNRVKISLRSDDTVDINQVAVSHGGGGHTAAAGAMLSGNLEKILPQLVAEVETAIKQQDGLDKGSC